jgi:hypothetical protein
LGCLLVGHVLPRCTSQTRHVEVKFEKRLLRIVVVIRVIGIHVRVRTRVVVCVVGVLVLVIFARHVGTSHG